MLDINKNYWLYIASHVYCHMKAKQALLYNTQTGASMETTTPKILALLQSLHEKKNLGAIHCEGKMLAQNPYQAFVSEFCEKGMGNLVDVAQTPEKPVQLMPVLNLQHDIDRLQKEKGGYIGEDVLRYLLELNIYLHTGSETLPISLLQNILSQIRYGTVGKINLRGDNIVEYPHYQDFPTLFTDFKEHVHLWSHYANFTNCKPVIFDFQYDISITFPVDENAWNYCLTLLNGMQVRYHFDITNEAEYEKATMLIEKYGISHYAIHPVYTKDNQGFFEEFIYTNREDIFQTKLSFRQIFAHQKLNTHFFGSLMVLANGEVRANVNSSALGNICCDTLLDIVNKEMLTNTAWRKIRDMAPCSDCLYQYLCPSPSNYEAETGKPNLCHIKK